MTKRFVYDVFSTNDQARAAISDLISKGVPRSAVVLVSNAPIDQEYGSEVDVVTSDELIEGEERSWWDNVLGFFSDDEEDTRNDDIDYKGYEASLNRGDILVLIDQEYEGAVSNLERSPYTTGPEASEEATGYATAGVAGASAGAVEPEYEKEAVHTDTQRPVNEASSRQETPPSTAKTADNDTERIRLHEEQVDVQKHKKDLGEVQVSKNVVEDTKTVEVPIQREEIHIKKVTPSEGEVDDNAFEEEEFVVPISEEEVSVNKNTVVTGEVEIEKQTHQDTETVSETTRREELDVQDDTGKVIDDDAKK